MRLGKLLQIKTNLIVTLSVAVISSVTTVAVSEWLQASAPVASNDLAPVLSQLAAQQRNQPDLLACETGVYSPVQNRCVDQQIFDAEMKRLFAALGLDAGAYSSTAPVSASED